jgi:hypothetical protein
MASRVLTSNAQILSRISVFPLSIEDTSSAPIKEQIKEFDINLKNSLGNCAEEIPPGVEDQKIDQELEYDPYTD